jgi:hypothetical protein
VPLEGCLWRVGSAGVSLEGSYTICIIYHILYNLYSILYTMYYILYYWFYILYSILYILHNLSCIICNALHIHSQCLWRGVSGGSALQGSPKMPRSPLYHAPCNIQYTLHTIYYIICTVYYIQCIIYYIFYTIFYILYGIQ